MLMTSKVSVLDVSSSEDQKQAVFESSSFKAITGSEDSWMISYLDVFMLVAAVFAVMLMNSEAQRQEVERNAAKTHRTFEITIAEMNARTDRAENTPLVSVPNPASEAMKHGVSQSTDVHRYSTETKWLGDLQRFMHQRQYVGDAALLIDEKGASLDIGEALLFRSGESTLTEEGMSFLDELAMNLQDFQGVVVIEGHTDNQPIKNSYFRSNWELASARSMEVLHFFSLAGLDESQLRSVSYGSTRPVVENANVEARKKNRRVSLKLLY